MAGWARATVAGALVCAVSGCSGTGTRVSLAGDAHSVQEARQRASVLLDRVYVPGAVRTEAPSPVTSSGNLVQEQRWYTLLGRADAIIAALQARPPGGLETWTPPFQSTATSAPLSTIAAGLRPVGQLDESQDVEVLATDVGRGRVRLKVEASVGWVGGRTPVETIPSAVTDVQLGIQFANEPDESMNRDNQLSATEVEALAASLNDLQGSTRDQSAPCLDAQQAQAVFTLAYGGHHLLFDIEVGGCNEVHVSLDGVGQPALADDESVTQEVAAILGIRLASA
ncbi:hypothetical protein acdb102_42380 [Acidothermaceae bacterium B102]|nr:hypothetical protein acdb102_42380 [Acidothermaceae bacterium B102]